MANFLSLRAKRSSLTIALFLMTSFLFYLYYVFYFHPPWLNVGSDMGGYIERAQNLAQLKSLQPYDSFYPVGMTYLLAPFFCIWKYEMALRMIGIFYALLLTGSNYLVYRLILDFYKSKTMAWVGLILASTYFPVITYLGLYLSEIPFMFFLLLTVYLFCKSFLKSESRLISVFWAGIAFGFALIMKGTLMVALPLLFFYLLYLCYRDQCSKVTFWKKVFVFTVSLLLVYAVQVSHITNALNKFTLFSTNGGLTTYLGQAHIAGVNNYGKINSFSFANNNVFFDKSLGPYQTLNFEVWQSGEFNKLTLNLWRQNPWRQVKVSLRSGLDLFHITHEWTVFDRPFHLKLAQVFQWGLVILIDLPILVYGCFYVFIRMLRRVRRDKTILAKQSFIVILLIFILSVIVTAIVTKGEPRYQIPFQYLIMIVGLHVWEKIFIYVFKLDKIVKLKNVLIRFSEKLIKFGYRYKKVIKGILLLSPVVLIFFLYKKYINNYTGDYGIFAGFLDAINRNGFSHVYQGRWPDYPPFFLYLLFSVDRVGKLLHSGSLLYSLKYFTLLSSLGSAYLAYLIIKSKGFWLAWISAIILLFNPVLFYDGSIWGQVDGLIIFSSLLFIYLVQNELWIYAPIVLVMGLLTKTQFIIILPFLMFFYFNRFGLKKSIKGMGIFLLGMFIVLSPYILHHTLLVMWNVVYATSTSRYPVVSANAYNIWWPYADPKNFWLINDSLVVSGLSAKLWGLILFSIFYLLNVGYAWFKRSLYDLLFVLGSVFFGFFMLNTQMHERYFVALFGFWSLILCLRNKLIWPYIVLTLTGFINLVFTHYPFPGLTSFRNNNYPSLSYLVVYINIFVLLWLICELFTPWLNVISQVKLRSPKIRFKSLRGAKRRSSLVKSNRG